MGQCSMHLYITYKPYQQQLLALCKYPLELLKPQCFLWQPQCELLEDQSIKIVTIILYPKLLSPYTYIIAHARINIFFFNNIFKCVQFSMKCCVMDQYCVIFLKHICIYIAACNSPNSIISAYVYIHTSIPMIVGKNIS